MERLASEIRAAISREAFAEAAGMAENESDAVASEGAREALLSLAKKLRAKGEHRTEPKAARVWSDQYPDNR
jgi:hypothetical protein